MTNGSPVKLAVALMCLTALVLSSAVFYLQPPQISSDWFVAFLTLLALSVFSIALALRRTAGGTTTALDFIPQLGALLIVGPAGAILVTLVSELISQRFFQTKPPLRAIFNVAQLVAAVALAGIIFTALGGIPSRTTAPTLQALIPFLGASVGYFSFNTTAVSFVVAKSQQRPLLEVLSKLSGGIGVVAADLVMSLLGLAIAFLYGRWGPLALLLAALPIIGLRYSYGINIELRQLNRDLLRVLIKALEARDPYTSGHSVRVAERAKLIADALGLGRALTRNIETAALLHDIGKIDQAYHDILRHKGPLSDQQRKLIKEHPDRGVDLISSVRSLDDQVLKFIRHHHERYDGTGYPDGLSEDEIPIGARIIMVSDTIDAMLTARPYRESLDFETAKQELINNKGTQFDPAVVDVALEIGLLEPDKIREIEEKATQPAAV